MCYAIALRGKNQKEEKKKKKNRNAIPTSLNATDKSASENKEEKWKGEERGNVFKFMAAFKTPSANGRGLQAARRGRLPDAF